MLHRLPTQEVEAERRDREEEHRIAHVALTRAKERLYLTVLKTTFDLSTRKSNPATPAHFLQNLTDMGSVAMRVRELSRGIFALLGPPRSRQVYSSS